MYSVPGFVGHNKRISIKCGKRGASFVINRTAFCCCYTVIQFVNLQQDCSSTRRQFPNNSLLSLSTICHQAWRLWYVNLSSKTHLYIFYDILIAYVRFVALISFSSCSNTVITAAALHYQIHYFLLTDVFAPFWLVLFALACLVNSFSPFEVSPLETLRWHICLHPMYFLCKALKVVFSSITASVLAVRLLNDET